MGENARRLRFTGHIAGLGTGSGVRMVIGSWRESPFGRFADVMVEAADGQRILLAPTDEVAEFVSATYDFDSVDIGPIGVEHDPDGFSLTAPGLDVAGRLGGPAPFDGLLRLVPPRLATAPAWLRAIDPVASRLIPGVRTAGSAGNGRREYYGVRRSRRIVAVAGSFRGADLDGLVPLDPPVRFGFSSAPSTPQMVSVTTTIDLPAR
ncbi:hypothetical protein TUM20985_07950 [Mycobacterium antarcticum]|uniref:hypothetical protein n=1 Tax=unclassified Mycolicibacterium TaxID=2636767 RepID=UPI002383FE3E|nr:MULTISPECIES: hypothetical protein [unclassified Mycolicibacterium]BDX30248.1 hypothetical protein TUM20985_07950 [Mycolicibacterium sp. TUM20985]GLP73707.1 hypothetical protein TUM20983_08170 [Mycolicibacterium sp. TUM20983]